MTGTSEMPVRISIHDEQVGILLAGELWGQDTMDTLEAFVQIEGKGVRSLVMGLPASG